MQLRAQPSHRYLIEQETEQSSYPASPQSPTSVAPWDDSPLALRAEEPPHDSYDFNPSNAPNSVANNFDGRHLDSLRDSTNRLSYMSSGQRTLITSRSSSPSTSPITESCSTIDDFPPKSSTEDSRMRQNASAIHERRRSMQTMSIPVLEAHSTRSFRTRSTYGIPSRPIGTSSGTTPNFSVPNSSSKRFSSIAKSPPPKIDTLNVPNIVTTAYESADVQSKPLPEATHQRRGSPAITREPVPELHSRPQSHNNESSRASTPPKTSLPERRSSLLPYRTSGTDNPGYSQFPRRYSTLPTSNDTQNVPSAKPMLPAFSFPGPHQRSSMTLEPPQSSPYISIEQETSERPPVSFSKKLRRPVSMVIGSSPIPLTQHLPSASATDLSTTSLLLKSPVQTRSVSPLRRLPHSSPPIIIQERSEEKTLTMRKSMPVLVNGPPPAPPPRCALPPLPPPQKSYPPVSFTKPLRV